MARVKRLEVEKSITEYVPEVRIISNFLLDYVVGNINYAKYKLLIEEADMLNKIKEIGVDAEISETSTTKFIKLQEKIKDMKKDAIPYIENRLSIIPSEKDAALKAEIGIDSGKTLLFLANNGVGKTTYALQMMLNIMDMYETESTYYDVDGGLNLDRISRMASRFEDGELLATEYFHPKNKNLTAELIEHSMISELKERTSDKKGSIKKELMMKSPAPFHDDLEIMTPWIYCMDTLSKLSTNSIVDRKDGSDATNMDGQMKAKANKRLFMATKEILSDANSIFIILNHLAKNVATSQFQQAERGNDDMAMGLTARGGSEQFNHADLVVQMSKAKKYKTAEDSEYGFVGAIVNMTIVKSRHASPHTNIQMMFNYAEGFDELFSEYLLLKNNGRVNVGGWSHLEGLPDIKFRQREFKQKYYTSPELRKQFHILLAEEKVKLMEPSIDASDITRVVELNEWLLEPTRYLF